MDPNILKRLTNIGEDGQPKNVIYWQPEFTSMYPGGLIKYNVDLGAVINNKKPTIKKLVEKNEK